MFRVSMRLLGYLLLADGQPVSRHELWYLLSDSWPGRSVYLNLLIDRLRLAGCDIRTARHHVRLATLPPDELLEAVLTAVDELRMVGRLPRCAPTWDWGTEHEGSTGQGALPRGRPKAGPDPHRPLATPAGVG